MIFIGNSCRSLYSRIECPFAAMCATVYDIHAFPLDLAKSVLNLYRPDYILYELFRKGLIMLMVQSILGCMPERSEGTSCSIHSLYKIKPVRLKPFQTPPTASFRAFPFCPSLTSLLMPRPRFGRV